MATDDRAEARRLRRHGGRLRRRPGRREILRHQVPQGGPQAGRGRARRHRCEALKMHGGVAKDELREGKRGRRWRPAWRTSASTCATSTSSACRPSSRSTASRPTPTPRWQLVRKYCEKFGVSAVECTHWADGGAGAETWRSKVVETCRQRRGQVPHPVWRTSMPLWEKAKRIATRDLRRRRHHRRQEGAQQLDQFEEEGYGALPGLHGQDPVQLLDGPEPAWARRPATSCRSARCDCRPAPSSSWSSAARS